MYTARAWITVTSTTSANVKLQVYVVTRCCEWSAARYKNSNVHIAGTSVNNTQGQQTGESNIQQITIRKYNIWQLCWQQSMCCTDVNDAARSPVMPYGRQSSYTAVTDTERSPMTLYSRYWHCTVTIDTVHSLMTLNGCQWRCDEVLTRLGARLWRCL